MDTAGLLKSLNDHDVDYVVIGATAMPVHGYVRAKDLEDLKYLTKLRDRD